MQMAALQARDRKGRRERRSRNQNRRGDLLANYLFNGPSSSSVEYDWRGLLTEQRGKSLNLSLGSRMVKDWKWIYKSRG